jgi:hypothetical protein
MSDGDEHAEGASRCGAGAAADSTQSGSGDAGGDEASGSEGTASPSATIVESEAAGSGIAAASVTIGCERAGSDEVACAGVTVGRISGGSASIGHGSPSDGDLAGGGGGITGTYSPLGGSCVDLLLARACAKSAEMYWPTVAPYSLLVDGGAGPHDWIGSVPFGATNVGATAAARRRQSA